MELNEIMSPRVTAVLNSVVSQSVGCTEGDFFDWDALDLVLQQHEIDFAKDGLAILLAGAAHTATVIAMYAEDMGVPASEMHAEFVKGIGRIGPDSA